mmetsp:Transcript_26616/g.63457  ORF Transcript_26616/g.63457 Transcript_26616/m.63457 type:complete len:199 (-) Transcript_26616:319-915(-)
MMVLADSLVRHWLHFYQKVDCTGNQKRSKMLERMKDNLSKEGKVKVPDLNQLDNTTFKLYTTDYGKLFNNPDDEKRAIERQFIQDPFPVAVKPAINLSPVFYGGDMLLTACSDSVNGDSDDGLNCISGDGSVRSINKYIYRLELQRETANKLVGLNLCLPVVSDEEGGHDEVLSYRDDDTVVPDLTKSTACGVPSSQF